MNYKRVYDLLISKAQAREKPDCYTERHHIVPKALGGVDACTNLVHLTAREHCFAHLLLAKIYNTRGLWAAVTMMTANFKLSSRAYAKAKENYSKIVKELGIKPPIRWGNSGPGLKGKDHPMFGKKRPDLAKKNKQNIYAGKDSGTFKSSIEATNKKTGEKFIFVGAKELIEFGFSSSNVYTCLAGRLKSHKGHTFKRLEA